MCLILRNFSSPPFRHKFSSKVVLKCSWFRLRGVAKTCLLLLSAEAKALLSSTHMANFCFCKTTQSSHKAEPLRWKWEQKNENTIMIMMKDGWKAKRIPRSIKVPPRTTLAKIFLNKMKFQFILFPVAEHNKKQHHIYYSYELCLFSSSSSRGAFFVRMKINFMFLLFASLPRFVNILC